MWLPKWFLKYVQQAVKDAVAQETRNMATQAELDSAVATLTTAVAKNAQDTQAVLALLKTISPTPGLTLTDAQAAAIANAVQILEGTNAAEEAAIPPAAATAATTGTEQATAPTA
jgi:indole-3-glycerol phosphate synthase